MSEEKPHSMLEDELALCWNFLEEESDACVVVSSRMELVFINSAGRQLLPEEWFGKRCFEVLPVGTGDCAWDCPTIRAVDESEELVYCEEHVNPEKGPAMDLGVGVIPLPEMKNSSVKAILVMRMKSQLGVDEEKYREDLLRDAAQLRERVRARLS